MELIALWEAENQHVKAGDSFVVGLECEQPTNLPYSPDFLQSRKHHRQAYREPERKSRGALVAEHTTLSRRSGLSGQHELHVRIMTNN